MPIVVALEALALRALLAFRCIDARPSPPATPRDASRSSDADDVLERLR